MLGQVSKFDITQKFGLSFDQKQFLSNFQNWIKFCSQKKTESNSEKARRLGPFLTPVFQLTLQRWQA